MSRPIAAVVRSEPWPDDAVSGAGLLSNCTVTAPHAVGKGEEYRIGVEAGRAIVAELKRQGFEIRRKM